MKRGLVIVMLAIASIAGCSITLYATNADFRAGLQDGMHAAGR